MALDSYGAWAHNILSGKGLVDHLGVPSAHRMPLYPLFLAGIYALFGQEASWVWLLQCVLGALTAGLVYALAENFLASRWALLAGLLAVAYPPFLRGCGFILTETLFTFLWVGALCAVGPGLCSLTARRAVLAGVLFGLATLTRPLAFWFPFGLVGLQMCRYLLGRSWPKKTVLALLLGFSLTLAPWALRNWVSLGSPIVTSTEAGWSLWLGLHPDRQGMGYNNYEGFAKVFAKLGVDYKDIRFTPKENQMLLRQSVKEIGEDPGRFLRLAVLKTGWFFNPFDGDDYRLGTAYNLPAGLLITFAALGLVLTLKCREFVLLRYTTFYFIFFAAVVYGMPRLRIPLEPLLLVLAVGALAQIRQMRADKKLFAMSLVCVLVYFNVVLAFTGNDAKVKGKSLLERTVGYSQYFKG